MNPLVHNPLHLADRAGLWIAGKIMRFAYIIVRVSPVAMLHAPRILFLLFSLGIFVANPMKYFPILLGMALFALLCLPKLHQDLPSIRSDWNAHLYKHYQARALYNRDHNTSFRRFTLLSIPLLTLVSLNGSSQESLFVSVANLCMLLCLFAGLWLDACDLPEPDDGDAFARPHAA